MNEKEDILPIDPVVDDASFRAELIELRKENEALKQALAKESADCRKHLFDLLDCKNYNAALRDVYRRAIDTYPQSAPMTAELIEWWGAVYRGFLVASGEKT